MTSREKLFTGYGILVVVAFWMAGFVNPSQHWVFVAAIFFAPMWALLMADSQEHDGSSSSTFAVLLLTPLFSLFSSVVGLSALSWLLGFFGLGGAKFAP
ncbi:hypothetical protein [Rhodovulum sp. ES.010]|uniref:hypothetical protein n=1 Tax=Rhodovulum sp. ES.010 TaxID=1882821 RepID=UPI0011153E32|nr:hypothetical protein [Rhodovulum sp. ES.010]